MSVVLLVRDRGGASYVTPQRIRVRDRVAARVHAARLDAALAQGVAPEASAALELRAQALIGPVARKLGLRLSQILLSAQFEGGTCGTAIPICAALVREAQPELNQLVGRLLGGGPVGARGVATVGALLCNGAGPLYGSFREAAQLRAALSAALDALEVDA
jgi:hypothetical protein